MTLISLIKHPRTLSSRPHRCVAKSVKIRENQWLKNIPKSRVAKSVKSGKSVVKTKWERGMTKHNTILSLSQVMICRGVATTKPRQKEIFKLWAKKY